MTRPLHLTTNQVISFDHFMLDSTANSLRALEIIFELSIGGSSSSIEIAPAAYNASLKNFGEGSLYIISSDLLGEVNGNIVLFLRADDFNYLSEVMKPAMSVLFMANPDENLAAADSQKPYWLQNHVTAYMDEDIYREHMMDTLAEMGNILIGLYSKSIYKICELNSHHSVPLVMKEDPEQETLRAILSASDEQEQQHLVIENEFYLNEEPITLWCLFSPTSESFRDMLNGIDRRNESRGDEPPPVFR